MRTSINAMILATVAALLQACGGGGTSYERDNAVVVNPSQTDVFNMAKLGASYNEKLAQFYAAHIRFAAGYVQTFALLNTGSTTSPAVACTDGGTADVVVTKAGTYVGLKAGDTVTATFKQCVEGSTTTDGVLTVKANADINQTIAANQLSFTLTETDLTLTVSSFKTRGNAALVVSPATVSTNFNYQYTGNSPTKQEFFQSGSTSPSLVITHTNASGRVSETVTDKSYAASGTLGISTGSSSLSFDLVTTPALVGPLPTTGNLIPVSGVYQMTNISGFTKLAVKVTAGATTATVAGYFSGVASGTPDNTQNVPYSSLYL